MKPMRKMSDEDFQKHYELLRRANRRNMPAFDELLPSRRSVAVPKRAARPSGPWRRGAYTAVAAVVLTGAMVGVYTQILLQPGITVPARAVIVATGETPVLQAPQAPQAAHQAPQVIAQWVAPTDEILKTTGLERLVSYVAQSDTNWLNGNETTHEIAID